MEGRDLSPGHNRVGRVREGGDGTYAESTLLLILAGFFGEMGSVCLVGFWAKWVVCACC